MRSNQNGILSNNWIISTFIIMLVIVIAFALIIWNPLIGCIAILLLLLTIYIGSVLRAYSKHSQVNAPGSQSSSPALIILDKNELGGSQRLLRYATAILAFLSLLTTAEGMQSFVFDKSWMAYLGSFAVQSILVVFTLLLCRFYVHVAQLKWPTYIRKLVNGLLIAFFCLALIVSSSFSFSYIGNNAYQGNWLSDSEMIIQTHLMDSVYSLQQENERRGNIILSQINETASENLSTAIESINTQQNDDLATDLQEYINSLSFVTYTDSSVIIPWDLMRQSFPQYTEDIDVLADAYDNKTYLPEYRRLVNTYNTIASEVENWDASIPSLTVSSHINTVSDAISILESLSTNIVDWKSHSLNNDIAAYRTNFQAACSTLITQFERLNGHLDHILHLVDQLEGITQNSIDADLNTILSQIYLLGVDDTVSVSNISNDITDLALQASNKADFSSDNIANIMELCNLLTKYSTYKNLSTQITSFIDSNLKNNYQIVRETSNDSSDDHTPSVEDSTDSSDVITESTWYEVRNNDFNTFYKMVKSLPILDDAVQTYDAATVILETSQIQRDLLGESTDFERAFSYFKYRFPFMAFFSAFIAVFFDLGSFLTGCFLYVTEYFNKEENQVESEQINENDPS